MYGYIYLTENLIDNRCYIGQHKAKSFSKKYIGSGKILRQAIKKYGKENFVCQPIQWCETLEELDEAEKYWIAKCDATNNPCFYNIDIGGYGRHSKLSDETRLKMSITHTGKPGPNTGRKLPDEWKENIGKGQKGLKKPMTEKRRQHLENLWEARKGKPAWNKGLTKETDERVAKIANTLKTTSSFIKKKGY